MTGCQWFYLLHLLSTAADEGPPALPCSLSSVGRQVKKEAAVPSLKPAVPFLPPFLAFLPLRTPEGGERGASPCLSSLSGFHRSDPLDIYPGLTGTAWGPTTPTILCTKVSGVY